MSACFPGARTPSRFPARLRPHRDAWRIGSRRGCSGAWGRLPCRRASGRRGWRAARRWPPHLGETCRRGHSLGVYPNPGRIPRSTSFWICRGCCCSHLARRRQDDVRPRAGSRIEVGIVEVTAVDQGDVLSEQRSQRPSRPARFRSLRERVDAPEIPGECPLIPAAGPAARWSAGRWHRRSGPRRASRRMRGRKRCGARRRNGPGAPPGHAPIGYLGPVDHVVILPRRPPAALPASPHRHHRRCSPIRQPCRWLRAHGTTTPRGDDGCRRSRA